MKKTDPALRERIKNTDFGALYTKEKTAFSVFATEAERVRLEIFDTPQDDNPLIIDMMGEPPFYQLEITGDLAGKYYRYSVRRNKAWHVAQDPWAMSMTTNSALAMITDFERTHPKGWESHSKPDPILRTEAVIYETHLRDSTVSRASSHQKPGTYLGFAETGTRTKEGLTTGLEHLKELGITHVHLLPLHDMGSVDESLSGDSPNGEGTRPSGYNWGYDPMYYMVPEGSYATDPADGSVRVREMKQMIQNLHEAGLRVVLDVVYNHTYVHENHPFEILAPGWYYRKNKDGSFGDGSGCGNETDSQSPIFQKLVLDSLSLYLKAYQVDGFRFDLLALHDQVFVREMEAHVKAINPNALLYGEPWTGGKSLLPKSKQFRQGDQKQMAFALFNDHLRNAVKGDNDGTKKGFVSGGQRLEKQVAMGIVGGTAFDPVLTDFTQKPGEAVNYVSCHDNLCLYDKLKKTHPEESDELLAKRSLMALSVVLLSFGTAFIQGGTEILRTKYGDHNSFISGDQVNEIQWERKALFSGHYQAVRTLISLRKTLKCFALDDETWLQTHVRFERLSGGVIAYTVDLTGLEPVCLGQDGQTAREIRIIHNASSKPVAGAVGVVGVVGAVEIGETGRASWTGQKCYDSEWFLGAAVAPGAALAPGAAVAPLSTAVFWC